MRFIPHLLKKTMIYNNLKYAYYSLIKKRHSCKKKENISMVFLVKRSEVWNSVKSVYDAAKKCENISVYLVALPPYKQEQIMVNDYGNYEFCCSIDSNAICAYDKSKKSYFDLEQLKPDYIFLSVPYEYEYPSCYQFKYLGEIAHLVYISYGYTMIKSKMQKVTIKPSVIQYADYIFACNRIMYNSYLKVMMLSQLVGGKRLYNIGFPRFDLYRNLPAEKQNNKTILWLPRWTTVTQVRDGNEPSSFFEVKDKILMYMKKKTKETLIIRPHPKAFENYIKDGLMSEDDVERYKDGIAKSANVSLDKNSTYYDSLIQADILVADFTSILAEYFVMGRPILYFGDKSKCPPIHREMYESFYCVETWEMAEEILEDLIRGNDPKKEQRKNAVDKFVNSMARDVGERIIGLLMTNYEKEGKCE